MVAYYYNVFGTKLKLSFSSPLKNDDHPELETYECLDSDSIQKYQSMIDTIQSAVSLDILDINPVVMTPESFIAEHRQVYLDRCKRVVSYLVKFKWATIRIMTKEPDLSSTPTTLYDWEESVNCKVKELTTHDAPVLL